MRLRSDARTSPRRPSPLQLEVLESRRVLSGGTAFLAAPAFDPPSATDTPAITAAPADSYAQDPGKGQGNQDARSADGRGLGSLVSTWTHEGIHGQELAALIHQAQGKDGGNSGGGNTGGSGGQLPTPVVFSPPPGAGNPGVPGHGGLAGSDGRSGQGQSSSTGQEDNTSGTAAAHFAQGPVMAQRFSPETTSPVQGGSTVTQPDVPTDQGTFLPGAPVLVLSPVGQGSISGATLASSPGIATAGLSGLPLVTGLHNNLTSFAAYAPSGLSPLEGAQGITVRVGTPEVAEQAGGGVQMALPSARGQVQPGGADEGPEVVLPAAQESDLLTNVLAANFPGLEGQAGDLVRGLEDLLARLGMDRVGWAFAPALAAAAGALAYVEVRRRRRRNLGLASSPVLAPDTDTGSWFPDSDGMPVQEEA